MCNIACRPLRRNDWLIGASYKNNEIKKNFIISRTLMSSVFSFFIVFT